MRHRLAALAILALSLTAVTAPSVTMATPDRSATPISREISNFAVPTWQPTTRPSPTATPKPKPKPKPKPVVVKPKPKPVVVKRKPKPKPLQHKVVRSRPTSREETRQPVHTGSPKDYARSLVGPAQFGCLNLLWERESGWSATAANPSSSAYGIPQALPGSKMRSAGTDWRTNPRTQIRWGLGYIGSRYGTPCNAWAHSQSHGWY